VYAAIRASRSRRPELVRRGTRRGERPCSHKIHAKKAPRRGGGGRRRPAHRSRQHGGGITEWNRRRLYRVAVKLEWLRPRLRGQSDTLIRSAVRALVAMARDTRLRRSRGRRNGWGFPSPLHDVAAVMVMRHMNAQRLQHLAQAAGEHHEDARPNAEDGFGRDHGSD
jgi:hypothetical protein